MKTILLLEDLPEIRAWLRKLVLQVFPDSQISESARVADALATAGEQLAAFEAWSSAQRQALDVLFSRPG